MKQWENIYKDANVTIRTDGQGRVGIWHGATGKWRLVHVAPDANPIVGHGATMHEARAEVAGQKP